FAALFILGLILTLLLRSPFVFGATALACVAITYGELRHLWRPPKARTNGNGKGH
ncbi:MAG: hypothetical protein QOC79_1909, partial [Actinomycetota bacterium]|nr:hypothetical protein [Actinomycetota bacterium]